MARKYCYNDSMGNDSDEELDHYQNRNYKCQGAKYLERNAYDHDVYGGRQGGAGWCQVSTSNASAYKAPQYSGASWKAMPTASESSYYSERAPRELQCVAQQNPQYQSGMMATRFSGNEPTPKMLYQREVLEKKYYY